MLHLACLSYRELFRNGLEAGLVDECRNATNGNFGLADARFKEQIGNALKRREIPGKAE